MSLNLEVEVDVPFTFDYEALAGEVVAFTIDHEGFPYEAEVNLTLTDNEGIHEINRMYRQIDAPTDVLSFPMLSYEQAGDFSALEEDYEDNFNPDTGEIMLGDIVGGPGERAGCRLRTQRAQGICVSDRAQHASSVRV